MRNPTTHKLDHKIKFMGETILKKAYSTDEVFTGPLQVWISDEWHWDANKNKITQFVYEIFD